ncbi:MAG TPA: ABC transporter permease, partial [Plasticicumulans sp.]|nr:ABC transporter permease [Plasticicumulans sp.]
MSAPAADPAPLAAGLSPRARAWRRFRANRRGWWSLWIFGVLFGLSLGAELLSNDRPLLVHYEGAYYFPLLKTYPETAFGGDFDTEADYHDPYLRERLAGGDNWLLDPPNPYRYDTIRLDGQRA